MSEEEFAVPVPPLDAAPAIVPNGRDVALVFLSTLFILGGSFGIIYLMPGSRAVARALGAGIIVVGLAWQNLSILGGIACLRLRGHVNPFAVLGLRPLPWRGAIISVAMGISSGILISAAVRALSQLMGQPLGVSPEILLAPPGADNVVSFLSVLFLAGIAVPFFEEALFRGLLYAWLRHRIGIWPAAILSALAFGLSHGELGQFIFASLFGIVLAQLYQRSNSLWASIVAHMANNSMAILGVWLPHLLNR